MKTPLNIFFLIAFFAINCNNFGLLEKIENPGGETFTTNYYVFASSWTTMGDMSGQPYATCSGQIGTSRADCACTKAAAANNLRKRSDHQFRAYMGLSAPITIEARCRVAGQGPGCAPTFPGPWFNTVGNVVVNSFISNAGLIDGPIAYTETRTALSATDTVWTGASATGTHQNECAGWNSTVDTNINIGNPTISGTAWHNQGSANCSTLQRIYCFAAP